jgi:hypothetical protein
MPKSDARIRYPGRKRISGFREKEGLDKSLPSHMLRPSHRWPTHPSMPESQPKPEILLDTSTCLWYVGLGAGGVSTGALASSLPQWGLKQKERAMAPNKLSSGAGHSMRTSSVWILFSLLAVAGIVAVMACGGARPERVGHAPLHRAEPVALASGSGAEVHARIGGTMVVDRFVIPEGQTVIAEEDLVVASRSEIVIDGSLIASNADAWFRPDAPSITLIAAERIVIDGAIALGRGLDGPDLEQPGGKGGDLYLAAPLILSSLNQIRAGDGGTGAPGVPGFRAGRGGAGGDVEVFAHAVIGDGDSPLTFVGGAGGRGGAGADGTPFFSSGSPGGAGGRGGHVNIVTAFCPTCNGGGFLDGPECGGPGGPGEPGEAGCDGNDVMGGSPNAPSPAPACTDGQNGLSGGTAIGGDGGKGGDGGDGVAPDGSGGHGGRGGFGGSATGGDGAAGADGGDCCNQEPPGKGGDGGDGGWGGHASAGPGGDGGDGGNGVGEGGGGNGGNGGTSGAAEAGSGGDAGDGGWGCPPGDGGSGRSAGVPVQPAEPSEGGSGGSPGGKDGDPGGFGGMSAGANGNDGVDGEECPNCDKKGKTGGGGQ